MTHPKRSLAALLFLVCWASALPSMAASSTSSAASEGSGASIGSVSGSLRTSSDSSSATTTAANGDYKVIDVAAVPERPGTVRLALQAVDDRPGDDGKFFLYLPQAVVAQTRLAQGGIVSARQRPYGIEFAQGADGQPRQAFFLVLSDDWYRELQTVAVQL